MAVAGLDLDFERLGSFTKFPSLADGKFTPVRNTDSLFSLPNDLALGSAGVDYELGTLTIILKMTFENKLSFKTYNKNL